MKLDVACECGKRYRVKSELAGKRLRCKECGGSIEVEIGLAAELEVPEDDEPAPAPKQRRTTARPKAKSSTARSRAKAPAERSLLDDRPAEPAPGPLARGVTGAIAALREKALVLAGASLVCAVACFGIAAEENKIKSIASPQPSPITCAQLSQSGPGANAHVTLRDYVFSGDYVYQTEGKRWVRTYAPVFPEGSADHMKLATYFMAQERGRPIPFPKLDAPPVMIKTAKWGGHAVESPAQMERLAEQETLTGVVVNAIEQLDGEDAKLLRQRYPGVDFGKAWILEIGRPIRSGGPYQAFGVLAGLLAVGFLVFRFAPVRAS